MPRFGDGEREPELRVAVGSEGPHGRSGRQARPRALHARRPHPLRNTSARVPEESDLISLTRAFAEAGGNVEEEMSFYGPDPVYDLSAMGIGIFEGRDAIRAFLEGWMASYEEYREEVGEIRELGGGKAFVTMRESARPRGSDADARIHSLYAFVVQWIDGKIARLTAYPDIDEGRAAAERLAESRG